MDLFQKQELIIMGEFLALLKFMGVLDLIPYMYTVGASTCAINMPEISSQKILVH